MGKIRDLFKKVEDTKGIFPAKLGTIKDKNCKDLTEAEEVKKKWQDYAKKLYRNVLNDTNNHNGVVTYLEPDILECEVNWALGSIAMNTANKADGIPAELLEILKDDAIKVLQSIFQEIRKTQQWSQDWKRSVFIPMPKNAQTTTFCTHLTR